MHNDLGITKDDIKYWMREAVEQSSKDMISNIVTRLQDTNSHEYRIIVNAIVAKLTTEQNMYFFRKNISALLADKILEEWKK